MQIAVDASNGTTTDSQTVYVNGVSVFPTLIGVSKTTLSFPDTKVGTPTASQPTDSFIVSHAGGGTASVSLAPTGDIAAFEIISPTQFTLNPGDTRTVQIRFLAPPPPTATRYRLR